MQKSSPMRSCFKVLFPMCLVTFTDFLPVINTGDRSLILSKIMTSGFEHCWKYFGECSHKTEKDPFIWIRCVEAVEVTILVGKKRKKQSHFWSLYHGGLIYADLIEDLSSDWTWTHVCCTRRWQTQRGVVTIPKSVTQSRIKENIQVE